MKKAPAPTTIQSAFQDHIQHVNSIKQSKFQGTDNPRHLRVITVLMRRPLHRQELDAVAGCSNGPDLVMALRDLGLDKDTHLTCTRVDFIDRDGKPCRPGVYALTTHGKRLIWAWHARMQKGGANG